MCVDTDAYTGMVVCMHVHTDMRAHLVGVPFCMQGHEFKFASSVSCAALAACSG